jgi:prepilin-type N-terminal cleavage/methylation domain-containing protein
MTPRKTRRRGATLVELLVAMAIITALAAMALMLMPSITNKDLTLKGTAEVQYTCKSAQNMAQSSRLPRGVRFLIRPGTQLAFEMELLEAPLILVADPDVLVAKAADPSGVNGPRVEFLYELYNGTEPSIDPKDRGVSPPVVYPAGTIKRRHCYIIGLNSFQEAQVADGAVLVMPVLNAWSRINGSFTVVPNLSPRTLEVVLDVYPDGSLGAGGATFSPVLGQSSYRTYHFGLYGPPVPLLGEPTIPLPRDIAVDLEVSYPPARPGQPYYDIMFGPSGQTISTYSTVAGAPTGVTANSSVFLWVRDTSTVGTMNRASYATGADYINAFHQGGEQQIVGIRNGFVGSAPVLWPDAGGTYPIVNGVQQTPFSLAQNKLN